MIKVGDVVVFDFGEGNPNNTIVEIRTIVDGSQVVTKNKKGRYKLESLIYFELCFESKHARILMELCVL